MALRGNCTPECELYGNKIALDAFFMNFGVEWKITETSHPSFIDGG